MVLGMNRQISALLATEGVITVARHPALCRSLRRLVAAGVLSRPLPGTFVPADSGYDGWLRAISAWTGGEGALHAATAASLWLGTPPGPITYLAHPTLHTRGRILVWRHRVEPSFVVNRAGVSTVTPAYAAVEVAATDDGRALTEVLRRRLATPDDIEEALTSLAGTTGQAVRRCVVASCIANPWSYAELRLHRILRAAGITGWVANVPLRVAGQVLHPDVLFADLKIVIEFDGREHHTSHTDFIEDREKQNAYVTCGYLVLRFGWHHLEDPDYIVATIRKALALRAPDFSQNPVAALPFERSVSGSWPKSGRWASR